MKFARMIDKEEFLRKGRVKRNHVAWTLSPSLCPAPRRFNPMAREARQTKDYKYPLLRGGMILIRRDDYSPVVQITNAIDLSKL